MKVNNSRNEKHRYAFNNELNLLKNLNNANEFIVKYYDNFLTGKINKEKNLCLIIEYCKV